MRGLKMIVLVVLMVVLVGELFAIEGSFEPISDEILGSERHRGLYNPISKAWIESVVTLGRPASEVWAYLAFENVGIAASIFSGELGVKVSKDVLLKVAEGYVSSSPRVVCKELASSMMDSGLGAYRRNYARYKVWKKDGTMSRSERVAFMRDNYTSNYLGYGKDLWADVMSYKYKQGKYSSGATGESLLKDIASLRGSSSDVVDVFDKLKKIVGRARNKVLADYPPYRDHLKRIEDFENEAGVTLSLAKRLEVSGTPKGTLFHEKVKDYVESGTIFRSRWNNLTKVVLVKEIVPGTFLAIADFKEGGRQVYEIRSFEFPLPKEVISKVREVGLSVWSVETIEKKGMQSLGLIIVIEQLCSDSAASIFLRGAYYTEDEGWRFSYKKISGYGAGANEIAAKVYTPSSYLQNKYLGEGEINFLKDVKEFGRHYTASTRKDFTEPLRLEGYLSNSYGVEDFEGKWRDGVGSFNRNLQRVIVGHLIKGNDIYEYLRDSLYFYDNELYGVSYLSDKSVEDVTEHIKNAYNATSEKYIDSKGKEGTRWIVSDEVFVRIYKLQKKDVSVVSYFYKPIAELVIEKSIGREGVKPKKDPTKTIQYLQVQNASREEMKVISATLVKLPQAKFDAFDVEFLRLIWLKAEDNNVLIKVVRTKKLSDRELFYTAERAAFYDWNLRVLREEGIMTWDIYRRIMNQNTRSGMKRP